MSPINVGDLRQVSQVKQRKNLCGGAVVLTPLDVQQKEFKRSFRGYNEEEVDKFLDQVVQSYDALYLENHSLKEKLKSEEANVEHYLKLENTIKDAVIMAQKNAEDLQSNAQREAELQLAEARLRAEQITGDAEETAARTLNDARDKARYLTEEAEDRVKSVMEEYRFLSKQVHMFRVKFRSFLDAQISLLDEQDEEVMELMSNWETGWLEAAAGRAEDDTGASSVEEAETVAV